MTTPNMYWPVYKNLEKEFLTLANYIHFSDDQLDTYSMYIADLIVRCAIEIEAISKELYCALGGNMTPTDINGNPRDLYFDTDCLGLLEQKWFLSKKQIDVSAINIYFADEKNRTLTPLHKAHKRGDSSSKWQRAYQALKHDRKKSIKKATIENLLHALGSLYILNLYYMDERIDIGRVYLGDHSFDNRVGSELFSAHYCRTTGLSMQLHMNDSCISPPLGEEMNKAIFVIKYDDKSFAEMHKNFCLDHRITVDRFANSPEIKKYIADHPECKDKSINEICIAAGGTNLLARIICMQNTMREVNSRMEAVLNKHTEIYPELLPLEDESK